MESQVEPKCVLSIDKSDRRGSVARLVIHNCERINVLNTAMMLELTSAVESLYADERLRILILTGAEDRAFIGGADINEMVGLDSHSARDFITRLHRACTALRDLPAPVIARISGYCLGAGLEIAVSCDLRIAADHSSFGMPEVKVGIPSVIEAALLPTLIGPGRARELVYTGRLLSASEALRFGLVERIVPKEQLDSALDEWIEAFLQAGPRAIRLQKALVRRWEALPLNQAIESGIEAFVDAYSTDEPRLLMSRFLRRDRKKSCAEE